MFSKRAAPHVSNSTRASHSLRLGGFDGTSNLEAGRQFGIPVKGTHAHSYVQSHRGFQDVGEPRLKKPDGNWCADFVAGDGWDVRLSFGPPTHPYQTTR